MNPHDRKKIVILSAFYEPFMSGAEQLVKEIAERLGADYDLTIVTARLDRTLPKTEQRVNFKLIRVGWGIKKLDKLFYPILAAIKIRKIKPAIAHAVMESYAGGALVLVKYLCPSAFRILTLQSGDLDSKKKQKQLFIKLFWKKIHRTPHQLVAISNFLATRAHRLGIPKEKISVIPNGVDLSQIPSAEGKIPHRVICVARLSWEKGLDYLIQAWPNILKNIPDATLAIVGEGAERVKLEKLIKELNISNSIELKGNLSHNQVLKELSKSEIFICPSLAEGLGIVFIEAQACGVPVIGTNVGGIPDVIQNNATGLLVASRDSVSITEAIIKLLTDKKLADQLSNKAQEMIKQYDWSDIIKQYNKLYQNSII